MGHIVCFLRDGDRVFLTYSTTGRGNERVNGSLGLLDMTPYGRGEAWEDNPEGWPEGRPTRAGTGARTPTASPPGARPAGPCRSGPAPARPPWRPSAGTATTDAPYRQPVAALAAAGDIGVGSISRQWAGAKGSSWMLSGSRKTSTEP